MKTYLEKDYLKKLDGYFRACNYLSVAQLYLLDNPLLKTPLSIKDVKKKIVGHWGTVPGQNFVYAHCNRAINKYDLDMLLISGPGHGGNFFVANSYLEGRYSEVYPEVSLDKKGMTKLCKQFSFACGVSSHVAPETPGSMHEGGELGYSLAHGFGAVLDNPDLIATVIVGDGEAETGPLATSWHLNKFLNPKSDGAVLPILHLNGFKISNPTIFSRISKKEVKSFFEGCGWEPIFVEGDKPESMHVKMAKAMDRAIEKIKQIQKSAREGKAKSRQVFPMIVLRTPKGWTGPKFVDGKQIEGSFRAHQVPIDMSKPEHLSELESWLMSYRPDELFDENYRLKKEYQSVAPKGDKRISANVNTNGGLVLKDLIMPDFKDYAVNFSKRGNEKAQDMLELGKFVRDIFKLNKDNKNYRVFSPDEAMSNRLSHMFEVESRDFNAEIYKNDEFLSSDGRVMDSYLSEHACEGMLEGYLLTGRHGMFASYEAFIRVVDSMVSQHAKWLKICSELEWRKPISSLNLLLTSNVWQQDHNGYTHQEPGFLDHVVNKKADIVRAYLPPDANCLLSCYDHCQRSKEYINVIVASKHPSLQWLTMDEAVHHCEKGIGVFDFASNCGKSKPDIVIASCGDTATLEALACTQILKEKMPKLKIRFVNVVDLMKMEDSSEHPHGLSNEEFDKLFTIDRPVIFNFHGYPKLIHEFLVKRTNKNFDVHGYREEGSITTAFDMRVQNEIDRFSLVKAVVKALGKDESEKALVSEMNALLEKHKKYIAKYGVDMPDVATFKWNGK
jgi:xylulose-5-phosphate/fructose-6-phosphate phosphoketolase